MADGRHHLQITLAVSEHGTESEARAWIEEELPRARFPEWVARRRHGSAGAFIFGQIEQGFYVEDAAEGVAFEPDLDSSAAAQPLPAIGRPS